MERKNKQTHEESHYEPRSKRFSGDSYCKQHAARLSQSDGGGGSYHQQELFIPNPEAVRKTKELMIPHTNDMVDGPGPTAGSGAPKCKEIVIPGSMVGLVIGKGGTTINQLQKSTGAHMRIKQNDPKLVKEKPLKISGTKEQINHATRLVSQLIEENRCLQQLSNCGAEWNNYYRSLGKLSRFSTDHDNSLDANSGNEALSTSEASQPEGDYPDAQRSSNGGGGDGEAAQSAGSNQGWDQGLSSQMVSQAAQMAQGQLHYSQQEFEFYRSIGMVRETAEAQVKAMQASTGQLTGHAATAVSSQPGGQASQLYNTEWANSFNNEEAEAFEKQIANSKDGQGGGDPVQPEGDYPDAQNKLAYEQYGNFPGGQQTLVRQRLTMSIDMAAGITIEWPSDFAMCKVSLIGMLESYGLIERFELYRNNSIQFWFRDIIERTSVYQMVLKQELKFQNILLKATLLESKRMVPFSDENLTICVLGQDKSQILQLHSLCSEFTKYGSVRGICQVYDKKNGTAKGFAFVKFFEEHSVYSILPDHNKTYLTIEGQELWVNRVPPKESRLPRFPRRSQ